jgi:hypothetical protein
MNPNFTGTWQANLAQSKLFSPPPRELAIQIEHSENHLRQTITVIRQDGLAERVVFSCTTDGAEGHSTLNGQPIRGKASWVGDELIVESWMRFGDRELYFRDCWSLTQNGRTLIMDHRDDALAGQRTILERAE